MFNRGVSELLQSLPDWEGLDESTVYRLLSGAWLEVIERDELDSPPTDDAPSSAELRHLATALQVDAVLRGDQQNPVTRASAFVAAESLEIAKELDGDPDDAADLEQVLVALLYLIAGYDANARVAVSGLEIDPARGTSGRYALESVLSLLSADPVPDHPDLADDPDALLHERVEAALMLEVGDLVTDFTRWLRDPSVPSGDEAARLLELADLLRLREGDVPIAAHPTPQHFARVAGAALIEAGARAARDVPVPDGGPATFARFLERRCSAQPLLWPAAAEYAATALPGPSANAVVAVPTGAGKSAVADLAIQHAITRGWVLYIAPTNALVGQIRRQLRQDHPGVAVREFLGGVEYTTLPEESLVGIDTGEVLVMTPEKCSLALRQSAEAFDDLALVVFDEAHTLGDTGGRGVLSELVLAEVLVRAEHTTLLLMSALVENPDGLAAWLSEAQERETVVVREPWRPTRTLRALVGIDAGATTEAAQDPGERLEGMPPNRKHEKFEGRLAVLAGLRGPWSTDEPADYSLHRIGATTPMRVSRGKDGTAFIDQDSAKVRPTVEALAQLLGERGQKTMAFQPGSKHYSFRAALSLEGFGEVELGEVVESLVGLASAELGVPSLLGDALRKGAAVHTSALLGEERRASEVAFIDGGCRVMFATGTLAQGLNLPATAVIVGGTKIGYSPDQSADEELSQQRSQLLNAIGRSGRARVAMRSIALVVPNELPLLDGETVAEVVLPRAEFLKEEDASTAVTSALRPLLGRLEEERVNADSLYPGDHVVLSYLAPSEEIGLASRIIGRSWGAHQLKLLDQADQLAGSIEDLGRHSLGASAGPEWAAEAARRSGVAVPVAGRFCAFILGAFSTTVPETLEDWLELLVDCLGAIPTEELGLLLRPEAFRSTLLADLFSEDADERSAARRVLLETLRLWISGAPLSEVGGAAHGTGKIDDPDRTERSPIPRTIRLVDTGIGFGLTRAAGLLAAAVDVAVEEEALPALDDTSHQELERLPVVLRFGASDPVALALLRAGARPRVIAHLLADLLEPPSGEEALRDWAQVRLRGLDENVPAEAETDSGRLVAQFLSARGSR
jgi:DEAD/DEAH box helicase